MEMAWVHGVRMADATAAAIAAASRACDITLTVHAPYYVNLCGAADVARRSRGRLIETCRLAERCGAESVCFHPGFYGSARPAAAARRVQRAIRSLAHQLRSEGVSVDLRPELTGRASQIGSFEELLSWCDSAEGIAPCLDFAHHYARTRGTDNGYDVFRSMLESVRARLGDRALSRMHVHLSGIEYGPAGERRHRPLRGSAFRYRDVVRALHDAGAAGWVICESPEREDDALHLQRLFRRLA
jgi:deoxyribonuclease IV